MRMNLTFFAHVAIISTAITSTSFADSDSDHRRSMDAAGVEYMRDINEAISDAGVNPSQVRFEDWGSAMSHTAGYAYGDGVKCKIIWGKVKRFKAICIAQ